MVIEIIQQEKKKLICDFCKKEYEIDAIHMEFWYGSELDTNYANFCSDKCCYNWVTTELKLVVK